jgi:hypothetical protein
MLIFISVSRCCADNAELFVEVFIRLSREAGFVYYSGVHFVSLVSARVCVYFYLSSCCICDLRNWVHLKRATPYIGMHNSWFF